MVVGTGNVRGLVILDPVDAVVTGATVTSIVAGTADDAVVAVVASQCVIPKAAIQPVASRATTEIIVSDPAAEPIVADPAAETVVPSVAGLDIVPGVTGDDIPAATAHYPVISGPAMNVVRFVGTTDHVVTPAGQHPAGLAQQDDIASGSPLHDSSVSHDGGYQPLAAQVTISGDGRSRTDRAQQSDSQHSGRKCDTRTAAC